MSLVITRMRNSLVIELRNLGVNVDVVLKEKPTIAQLADMRDKLVVLSESVKAVPVPRV